MGRTSPRHPGQLVCVGRHLGLPRRPALPSPPTEPDHAHRTPLPRRRLSARDRSHGARRQRPPRHRPRPHRLLRHRRRPARRRRPPHPRGWNADRHRHRRLWRRQERGRPRPRRGRTAARAGRDGHGSARLGAPPPAHAHPHRPPPPLGRPPLPRHRRLDRRRGGPARFRPRRRRSAAEGGDRGAAQRDWSPPTIRSRSSGSPTRSSSPIPAWSRP